MKLDRISQFILIIHIAQLSAEHQRYFVECIPQTHADSVKVDKHTNIYVMYGTTKLSVTFNFSYFLLPIKNYQYL
jgi:hypothetical protein